MRASRRDRYIRSLDHVSATRRPVVLSPPPSLVPPVCPVYPEYQRVCCFVLHVCVFRVLKTFVHLAIFIPVLLAETSTRLMIARRVLHHPAALCPPPYGRAPSERTTASAPSSPCRRVCGDCFSPSSPSSPSLDVVGRCAVLASSIVIAAEHS